MGQMKLGQCVFYVVTTHLQAGRDRYADVKRSQVEEVLAEVRAAQSEAASNDDEVG